MRVIESWQNIIDASHTIDDSVSAEYNDPALPHIVETRTSYYRKYHLLQHDRSVPGGSRCVNILQIIPRALQADPCFCNESLHVFDVRRLGGAYEIARLSLA